MHINSTFNIMKNIFTIENTVKYTLPFHKGDTVLIIAPHPDDETIGCGGTINKLLTAMVNVDILLLTYGGRGGKNPNLSKIRKEEFLQAKELLGNINAFFLGYEDGELDKKIDLLSLDISKIISRSNYNGIFVPYILDSSMDHRICNYSLAQALEDSVSQDIYIAMYEVWTPILHPNHYIDISKEFCKKYVALKCYKTQEKYYHIIEKTKLLNALRSQLSMRYNLEYMECFKGFSFHDYNSVVEWHKTNK